jgi:hypothetical protein
VGQEDKANKVKKTTQTRLLVGMNYPMIQLISLVFMCNDKWGKKHVGGHREKKNIFSSQPSD